MLKKNGFKVGNNGPIKLKESKVYVRIDEKLQQTC